MEQYSLLVGSFTIGHSKCINSDFIWVVKIRNTSEAVLWAKYHTDRDPTGLGQDNGLGEYCGPHTAFFVFPILLLCSHGIGFSVLDI